MAMSIPAFQSIYIIFLLLPALLCRLLVADLPADFFQNPLLILIIEIKKKKKENRHYATGVKLYIRIQWWFHIILVNVNIIPW